MTVQITAQIPSSFSVLSRAYASEETSFSASPKYYSMSLPLRFYIDRRRMFEFTEPDKAASVLNSKHILQDCFSFGNHCQCLERIPSQIFCILLFAFLQERNNIQIKTAKWELTCMTELMTRPCHWLPLRY